MRLTHLAVGIGAILAVAIFFLYDLIVRRAQSHNKPWIRHQENRRLPLACLGGIIYAASIFWLAWTSSRRIHWIVPMLAGLPFGVGFLLLFMALMNYMADAYGVYSASALAAASCSRSICGAVLPLATGAMYERLGVRWATSLLGFLSVGMAVVPWVFIWCGERIRARSKFARSLRGSSG